MGETTITNLPSTLTSAADDDLLVIEDASEDPNQTSNITWSDLIDSVSLSGGDGLSSIGALSGDPTLSLDLAASAGLKFSSGKLAVEPSDIAGSFLSDDGSDNLKVDLGDGLEGDGSGNIRVDEDFDFTFTSLVDFGGGAAFDLLSSDPSVNTESAIWGSDGTGTGADGDLIVATENSANSGLKTITLFDYSAGGVPNSALVNSSVTVTAGDGLKNGGSVSLGGSTTINVEPTDFAGHGLEDDGSDNLRIDGAAIGTGLNGGDGTNLSVDQTFSPSWTAAHTWRADGVEHIFEPTDVTSDGGTKNSPIVTLRAKHDSDTTASVSSANTDYEIEFVSQVSSGAQAGHIKHSFGATESFRIEDNGNVAFTSGSFELPQTTADYTVSWNDPSSARTLTVPDPGSNDTFLFEGRTLTGGHGIQTLGDLSADRTVAVDATDLSGNGLTDSGASTALQADPDTGISVSASGIAVDQTFSPNWTGTHSFDGSVGSDWTTLSSNTTLSVGTHYKVNVDSSGGSRTITLPDAPSTDVDFIIKRDGGNDVTVDTAGAENIDGSSSITLDADNDSLTVSYDSGATEWHIL